MCSVVHQRVDHFPYTTLMRGHCLHIVDGVMGSRQQSTLSYAMLCFSFVSFLFSDFLKPFLPPIFIFIVHVLHLTQTPLTTKINIRSLVLYFDILSSQVKVLSLISIKVYLCLLLFSFQNTLLY